MRLKAGKVSLSQKFNGNVSVDVDDAGDMVPEIKIEFLNSDIILDDMEKYELGKALFDKLEEIVRREPRNN
jgi:hypothetical protein